MVSAVSKEIVPVATSSTVDEPTATCVVKDETNADWKNSRKAFNLPASTLVDGFIVQVAKEFKYEDETFILVWSKPSEAPETDEIEVNLNKMRKDSQTLGDLGLNTNGKKNNFLIKDKDNVAPRKAKEAAEDIAEDSVSNLFQPISSNSTYGPSPSYSIDAYSLSKSDTGFVGLVNQAMTCYLNSLLQTLFMTPEFRNAIYRWEFKGTVSEEAKSIPYQLQRLFLKLQTSNKRAVETTDVTRSFGWDSSEAWQQHDVQELCRVMFDALEFNFKNTDQNDLINQLYQGKLKDYVKCLECGSENARSDTYLDIPLAIKPFGSQAAFGSVEEALQAFVSPETLNEGNQYFCEKCNKKCDAHKGLKFISFPYLLTMQLKRFAFDFATLHRIKLNDRMAFPKYLNLRRFVCEDHSENSDAELNEKEDSANGTETDSGVSEGCSDNGVSTEDEESDRGACAASCVEGTFVPDDLDGTWSRDSGMPGRKVGPHVYELFSIMIHSGSASGGHYYAYIKSFANGLWYCFNDQSVTRVYDDDIERTFGGSESLRSYYSPAYSSSTNAYMLMYRQVCRERNSEFMEVNRMPGHILDLINAMKKQDEADKRRRELDKSTCKIKVFCEHPVQKKMLEKRLEIHKDCTLQEAVVESHRLFELERIVPAEQCRLVKYDEYYDTIERSFHSEEQSPMGSVLCGVKSSYIFDLLLEIRRADEEFPVYKPGGTTVKALLVDLETGEVDAPVTVRTCVSATVKDLKKLIHEKLNVSLETLRVVVENTYSELRLLENPNKTLKDLGFFKSTKVFVEASGTEDDKNVLFEDSKFYQVLDVYQHSVEITVVLPDPRLKPPAESSMHVVSDEIDCSNSAGPEEETTVRIDKRISLGDFKKILEPKVGCPAELFRVYRVYSNNQETEYSKLGDPMSSFTDDSRVRIKYGRALKKGEWRLSVCMLRPNEKEVFKSLFDLIVSSGMSVRECKELLKPEISQRLGIDIPVENMRIRKKTWRNPSAVFFDSQTFDHDITVYTGFEICVEELEGPEQKTLSHHVSLYLRRWSPSSLKLGALKEVVLTERTVDCLKNEISRVSGIPLENVEFTKARGQFPSITSVLDIHEMDWYRDGPALGVNPLYICDDGVVIYYRDTTEPLMEISDELRQDILKKENAKSGGTSSTRVSGFSYKEKALKIYTDGKPGT